METIAKEQWPGVYTPEVPWSRARRRAVDRRTRAYKLWATRRRALVAEMGRTPTMGESALLDMLCDRLQDADIMRAERHQGIRHSENDARGAAAEIRRLMRDLGLTGRGADERSNGEFNGDMSDLLRRRSA